MTRKTFAGVGGLAAFVLVLGLMARCSSSTKGVMPEENGVRAVAAIGPDGVQRLDISGGSYYFDPGVIVVKVGVPVELSVRKAGGAAPHSIACKSPEAGIAFSVSLKKTPKSIRFTPTKTGTYPFWCTKKLPFLKSHRAHGMHGLIEVVD